MPAILGNDILKLLPHKHPFLFIDRVTEISQGKYAKGYKLITMNEPIFKNVIQDSTSLYRFVFPNALIIEALSQLGIVVIRSHANYQDKLCIFAGLKNFDFVKPVYVGDTLYLEGELLHVKDAFGQASMKASVNDELVVSGIITFIVADTAALS